MNHLTQSPQINVHKVDGSVATFNQSEAGLVNRILNKFHPSRIFNQEEIAILGNHSMVTFISSLITRVDLITDQLSVWDFPFVIGALLELTEMEFLEFLHERKRRVQTRSSDDFPMLLDVEMVNSQHSFLWMEVIAGFPTERLKRLCSLLKERSLIFGLRTGGIGVLNPANLVRFTVHPDPLKGPAAVWHTHEVNGSKFERIVRNLHGSANDSPLLSRFPQNNLANLKPSRREPK